MNAHGNERDEERWLNWWKRVGAQGDAMKVYRELLSRYAESHRAYHTLEHIDHCHREFEGVWTRARRPQVMQLALWYHDAVYDTHAKDNEQKSADLAMAVCQNAGLSDEFACYVADLILATRHATEPTDDDAQLLVDIDLAILGQPDERFDEYERQIRQEYAWVTDEAFASARIRILRGFLTRPRIYSTRFFRSYDLQARANLARSIRVLEGK